jgi:hypothetical protein
VIDKSNISKFYVFKVMIVNSKLKTEAFSSIFFFFTKLTKKFTNRYIFIIALKFKFTRHNMYKVCVNVLYVLV